MTIISSQILASHVDVRAHLSVTIMSPQILASHVLFFYTNEHEFKKMGTNTQNMAELQMPGTVHAPRQLHLLR